MSAPESKYLELRDRATFMPVLAVAISGADSRLAWRAGFSRDARYIVFVDLCGMRCNYDPHAWYGQGVGARTLPVAHRYASEHWDDLRDGDVVDVEYILGETETPKASEVG